MNNPTKGKYTTKPPIKVARTKEPEKVSRFIAFRLSTGLTQEELAIESGVSRKTISQIERGISPINDKVKAHLTKKYNLNQNWLDTGKGKDRLGEQAEADTQITLLAKVSRMERELNDLKNIVAELVLKLEKE